MVQNRRILERARFNLELANTNLAEGREKRKQNVASDADIFAAELHQQRAEYTAINAEDAFILSSEILARLSGTDTLREDQVPLDYPAPEIRSDAGKLASMLAHFLAQEIPSNTELELALEQMKISQNDLHAQRMALRPKLNLVAGLTQDEQAYDANIANKYEVQSLFVGVHMSWTIFDGFASKGRIKSSLEKMRVAEINYETKKSEILSNAQSYGRQFKSLALAIVITDRELDSAQNQLKYLQERRDQGEASDAQVNVAQLSLHDSTTSALNNRANYWNKLGEFLSLIDSDPILNRIR